MISEDSDEALPYCVSIGHSDKLVEFLTSRGNLQDAMMCAVATCEGSISEPVATKQRSSAQVNGYDGPPPETMRSVIFVKHYIVSVRYFWW